MPRFDSETLNEWNEIPDNGNLFSLLGQLKMTIGGLSEEVKAARDERRRFERMAHLAETPKYVRFQGSIAIPNPSVPVVITLNLDGPDSGHYWHVRKLAVGGATPTTAAAGRLDVFAKASDSTVGSVAALGLQDWQDQATTLPLIANYGDGELTLKAGEKLFLVITNGTAGQQYIVNGVAKDVQEAIVSPGGSI